jgi:hypothetical protein
LPANEPAGPRSGAARPPSAATLIAALVAAGRCSYQRLIVKSPRKFLLVYAVSIGDIGNELFCESPRGARSLSIKVELEGTRAFWSDRLFVL